MTDRQKQYALDNWKKETTSQMAEHLKVRPQDVANFLYVRGIQPITKRDLISKEVIAMHGNGETLKVRTIANKLGVSQQLIKEIIEDLDLTAMPTKPGPKSKKEQYDENDYVKRKISATLSREARKKEIEASRASFTVYNQTGSPILDELRDIKTTKREKTLLSTGVLK